MSREGGRAQRRARGRAGRVCGHERLHRTRKDARRATPHSRYVVQFQEGRVHRVRVGSDDIKKVALFPNGK